MKRALSAKNLWEFSPRPLKAIVGRVLGAVPQSWILGGRFRQWHHFLASAQWWDAEQVYNYQYHRLKDILTLAYHGTRFYKQLFRGVGFEPGDFKQIDDIRLLPTIDKTTVRENLDEMVTMSSGRLCIDYMSTSGTGGTPLCFYIGRDRSAVEHAHLAHSWSRIGYRPGVRCAVLRGHIVPPDRTGLHHYYDPLMRYHYYSSFHLHEEQLDRYVTHMHRTRPRFLHAYPSSAYILAQFLRHNCLDFPDSLVGIILESEPLYPHQRQFISENFPVRIYSSYGHTEKLVLAAECEHSTDYHVWPTYGYCELLDLDGRAVRDGVQGEIVGTGFINRVVPFIRYRTDDYATRRGQKCDSCLRNHPVLADLSGHRTHEFLVAKDYRSIVAWTALNMHDDTFDGIGQFQFVQHRAGFAVLNLVPASSSADYDLIRINDHLRSKFGQSVEIELRLCDKIEPDPSGKKPILKQFIPKEALSGNSVLMPE